MSLESGLIFPLFFPESLEGWPVRHGGWAGWGDGGGGSPLRPLVGTDERHCMSARLPLHLFFFHNSHKPHPGTLQLEVGRFWLQKNRKSGYLPDFSTFWGSKRIRFPAHNSSLMICSSWFWVINTALHCDDDSARLFWAIESRIWNRIRGKTTEQCSAAATPKVGNVGITYHIITFKH